MHPKYMHIMPCSLFFVKSFVHAYLSLSFQKLRHEIEQIEAWMTLREPLIKGGKTGQSIQEVEELLRRHADFEKTVDAQEERVNNLCKDKVNEHFTIFTALVISP